MSSHMDVLVCSVLNAANLGGELGNNLGLFTSINAM